MKTFTFKFAMGYRISAKDTAAFREFISKHCKPDADLGIAVWFTHDFVSNSVTIYADSDKHRNLAHCYNDLSAIGAPYLLDYEDWDEEDCDYYTDFATWAETDSAKAAWTSGSRAFCELCDSVFENIVADCAYWRNVKMAEDAKARLADWFCEIDDTVRSFCTKYGRPLD